MLQQPGLELELFVGFGKPPRSFRDAPLDFICNPLLLVQALCLIDRRTQAHAFQKISISRTTSMNSHG